MSGAKPPRERKPRHCHPIRAMIDVSSGQVDHFRQGDALRLNMEMEFHRNGERYRFLKWDMQAFENMRIVPPGFPAESRPRRCGERGRAALPPEQGRLGRNLRFASSYRTQREAPES